MQERQARPNESRSGLYTRSRKNIDAARRHEETAMLSAHDETKNRFGNAGAQSTARAQMRG